MWDGGPVNNLGQVLHRCPALGGEEVAPAAAAVDSSSADGPLIVGAHPFGCTVAPGTHVDGPLVVSGLPLNARLPQEDMDWDQ